MFHWICPECGREIAPTVRECPVCDDGAEQAELVLAGVVEASARTLQVDVPGTRSDYGAEPPRLAPAVNPLPEPVKWSRTPGLTAGQSAEQSTVEQINATPVATGQTPAATEQTNAAPVQGSRLSAEPLIPEILDAKAALDRAAESKASMRGMLDRTAEACVNQPIPVDGKVVATRTVESRTVGTKHSEAKLVEASPVEAKPVEVRSVETKVSEARPVETTSLETKTIDQVNCKPIEIQPTVTPQFDRVPLLAALSRLALPKIASTTAKSEPGKIDVGRHEPDQIGLKEASPAVEARIEEKAEAQSDALGSHSSTQPGAKPDAKAGVTPEAAQREPMLPTFAPPPRESLNALLAAASMLDEERADEGANDQPDPPVAGKLPLRAIHSAYLPAVAPAVVSIGAVSPRALPTMAMPNRILVKQGMVKDVGSPATAQEQKIAQKIAGLPLVESRFPLARPSAQALKFAAAATPVPASPRSGAVRAPHSPAPFLAPNAAGPVKYSPLEKRPILPVPPPVDLRRSETAPRITLPGPMLTRALVSFRDRELAPLFLEARAFRKRFAYGWLAIVLAVGTVLGVGFSSMVSNPARPTAEARPSSEGRPGAEASPNGANPAEAVAVINANINAPIGAPAHATGSNPLSKVIEVTGFRIVMDPTRKPQVQYLVVNHSSARFPDATIYVSLRAADARVGQAPLCRFSFAAPDLGPFEAKEMMSAIEKTNRTANLPEWQDLRAEIEIGQ